MNGYGGSRRGPYAPLHNLGAGLAQFLAAILTKKEREKVQQVEQASATYGQSQLTGDPGIAERFATENPEAVKEWEKRTGVDWPSVPEGFYGVPGREEGAQGEQPMYYSEEAPPTPIGEVMPGTLPADWSAAERMPGELPPRARAEKLPQRYGTPGGMEGRGPYAVTPPPTAEQARREAGVPWPTTGPGMKVRAAHEQLAGRELPPFMREFEPPKMNEILAFEAAYKPTEAERDLWFRTRQVPSRAPEEEALRPRRTPGIQAAILFHKAYEDATPEEWEAFRTTNALPTRPPKMPVDPMKMPAPMPVGQFAIMFDVGPIEIMKYQVSGVIPSDLKYRKKDAPTRTLSVSERRYIDRVLQYTGSYKGTPEAAWRDMQHGIFPWAEYRAALTADATIANYRKLLSAARAGQNKPLAKQLTKSMCELMGVPYKGGWNFVDWILSYTKPGGPQRVQELPPPASAEEERQRLMQESTGVYD